MVICLERGADLHMAQLMPLPLTVSCSSKIQIGFTFLVPAYPGCPGKTNAYNNSMTSCTTNSYEIRNISTIRTESVTSPQLYNKSNERRLSITKQRPDLTENVRKWQKFVPVATILEGSQPSFVAIINASRPTSWKKIAKIGRILFEQIGLKRVVQIRSSFGSQGHTVKTT